MHLPVLATKLYLPPPPPQVVARSRLVERLNEGLCQEAGNGRKLTLISAPAGFGKTTLVSAWATGCGRKVAWLSLDETDSQPARFLTYLLAAMRTVAPELGAALPPLPVDMQPPVIEANLTALINDIAALPERFILVLDDYHHIDSAAVDAAVAFLIEYLPPQLRLVITTREDPHLPLARLRARGQLTELRAADLRFSAAEAADFLRAMGLHLPPKDITALEARTEGWIAGLQLAALALQATPAAQAGPDASEFVQAFAGDHRYIMDYLVEEVLLRQPEAVRSFLLQTAILERLCGALCEAVTGQPNGQSRLEALERGNFLITPLDGKRQWYRYHHLFAEVLQSHLLAEQPKRVPELHRQASTWFEQQGALSDAIRHALAGQDFEGAARLVELVAPAMSRGRQETALLGWLRALPEALVRQRPVLCNLYAGVLLQTGEVQGVEGWLHAAERWLRPEEEGEPPPEAAMIVVDTDEFRSLPGLAALHRAGLAMLLGNLTGTMEHARRALALAPEDDVLVRGGAGALLGLVLWTNGGLEAAYQTYAAGIANVQKAGYLADTVASAITMADIRMQQGRLREALRAYERGLKLATEPGAPALRGEADMHVGLSTLLYEQGDLDAARQHLLRCDQLGEHMGLPQNSYRRRVSLARIREAEDDIEAALTLLDEAERVYFSDFSPAVCPVAAMRARVWIRQGQLSEASDWAHGRGLSTADELSYLREYEHITLARLLLAQAVREIDGDLLRQALNFLGRLLSDAESGGRTGSVIEILILQALAGQQQAPASQEKRDNPAALAPLEQALALAEPEGYVRIFVDEGPPMLRLLREAARAGISESYTQRLLAAFPAPRAEGALMSPTRPRLATPVLIEPLSGRELEVLRLFKTELSGPEIARRLVIGLSTLRTHTKSIYGKLAVNNRRAAVRRAEELDLI